MGVYPAGRSHELISAFAPGIDDVKGKYYDIYRDIKINEHFHIAFDLFFRCWFYLFVDEKSDVRHLYVERNNYYKNGACYCNV